MKNVRKFSASAIIIFNKISSINDFSSYRGFKKILRKSKPYFRRFLKKPEPGPKLSVSYEKKRVTDGIEVCDL